MEPRESRFIANYRDPKTEACGTPHKLVEEDSWSLWQTLIIIIFLLWSTVSKTTAKCKDNNTQSPESVERRTSFET